jgi:hypothetical protein
MLTERTNLYRVVAQTLQWIHGLTSMDYHVHTSLLAKIKNDGKTHYSVDVRTNHIRLGRIKHPLGLVAESIHVVMTGVITEFPDSIEFTKGKKNTIAEIEIEDMYQMFLKADNGGSSAVGVQTKIDLFTGGEENLSRNFIYRNNLLYQIR